jgi:hypothetical protein
MSVALSLASRSAKRENCDNTRKTDWHQYGHFGTTDGTVFRVFLGEATVGETGAWWVQLRPLADLCVEKLSVAEVAVAGVCTRGCSASRDPFWWLCDLRILVLRQFTTQHIPQNLRPLICRTRCDRAVGCWQLVFTGVADQYLTYEPSSSRLISWEVWLCCHTRLDTCYSLCSCRHGQRVHQLSSF